MAIANGIPANTTGNETTAPRRPHRSMTSAFTRGIWSGIIPSPCSMRRRLCGQAPLLNRRGFEKRFLHVAVHRLTELRVHLIRDCHNSIQKNAEIDAREILLQGLKDTDLQHT